MDGQRVHVRPVTIGVHHVRRLVHDLDVHAGDHVDRLIGGKMPASPHHLHHVARRVEHVLLALVSRVLAIGVWGGEQQPKKND